MNCLNHDFIKINRIKAPLNPPEGGRPLPFRQLGYCICNVNNIITPSLFPSFGGVRGGLKK